MCVPFVTAGPAWGLFLYAYQSTFRHITRNPAGCTIVLGNMVYHALGERTKQLERLRIGPDTKGGAS